MMVYLGIPSMEGAIMTYLDPAAFSDASSDVFHLRAVAKMVLEDRLIYALKRTAEARWDIHGRTASKSCMAI